MNKEFLGWLENEIRLITYTIETTKKQKSRIYENGKMAIITEIKQKYQETHASKSLEELGYQKENNTYFKIVKSMNRMLPEYIKGRMITFDKDKIKLFDIESCMDYEIVFTKAELQAILNKINELEEKNND